MIDIFNGSGVDGDNKLRRDDEHKNRMHAYNTCIIIVIIK